MQSLKTDSDNLFIYLFFLKSFLQFNPFKKLLIFQLKTHNFECKA